VVAHRLAQEVPEDLQSQVLHDQLADPCQDDDLHKAEQQDRQEDASHEEALIEYGF
jgi:hypothetical protein